MALMLIAGTSDAQKKKAKKTTPTDLSRPSELSIEIMDTSVAVLDSIPSTYEFVSVEVEPYPIQDIQSLVEYPEEAKHAGLEGKVILSALIDTSGKVIKVEEDRSTNNIFEESARKAVMKAKFTPAMGNGIPVRLWYTLPIVFKLNK